MKRVVITGMGVVSPIGNSIKDFWDSLINGKCGIDKIKGFDNFDLPVRLAAQVKDFNPEEYGLTRTEIRRSDLYCKYALVAASQAIEQSGLVSGTSIDSERYGVYIGSCIGGLDTFIAQTEVLINEGARRISPLFIPMMISNMAGGNVAIKYNANGPCLTTVSACSTGANAVGEAYRAIKFGYADAIVAGGSEAAVHPLTIGGFANCKALSFSDDPLRASIPFDKERAGFVLAEGAGIVVLEEYEHAKARGAEILAELSGYGVTCDAFHCTAPSPEGKQAARAIKMALEESDYDGTTEMYINAHGTGTPLNDKSETGAIKQALGDEFAKKVSVSSTKSMTGHMLGAAGAVEVIASTLALKNGIVPPTIGLKVPDPLCDLDYTPGKAKERNISIAISNSLGFGGHNVCLAMKKI